MNLSHFTQLLTTPADLARAAALTLLVVALLYLLKPKKRQVEVPFGGLWQRVLAESEARVAGRNLRRLLSFLLMLLLAGLLLTALADPLLGHGNGTSQIQTQKPHTVVILDLSASMQTGDTPTGTRLDEARLVLRDWLARAPVNEDVLLLGASGHTEVLAGWGSDRRALDENLQRVQATSGGLDLRRALETAQQALGNRAQPRVVLVSDGGPPELPLETTPTVQFEHLRVGPLRQWQPGQNITPDHDFPNLALVEVRVRPDPNDPTRGVLTARVRNDAGKILPAQLHISASDTTQSQAEFAKTDVLQRIVDVQVPPGLSVQTVPGIDLSAARFGVKIQGTPSFHDLAPYDDWAFAVLAEKRELGVLVVSGDKNVDPTVGNLYLSAALFAHGKVRVQHLAAADYHPEQFAAADHQRHQIDVVVLDQAGFALPEGTPGLILSLAAPGTETQQVAEGPELTVRDAEHPAMRGISFQDTNFDLVRLVPTRPGDVVLAAVKPKGAVLVARQAQVRTLEWGIDLLETDLGARYALPLLVSNALLWLVGDDDPLLPPLLVGRPWAVDAPVDAAWMYLEPEQKPRPARTSGRQLLGQSERHGVHVWQTQDRLVARATVLPPTENPALVQPFGPQAGVLTSTEVTVDHQHTLPRWALWLLAALTILTVEWLTYVRRRTV